MAWLEVYLINNKCRWKERGHLLVLHHRGNRNEATKMHIILARNGGDFVFRVGGGKL